MSFARLSAAVLLLSGAVSAADVKGVVDLDGRPVDPLTVQDGTRAHVLVFTTTECPISNRYAPELRRLAAVFGSSGVRFVLVYPASSDDPAKIRAHTSAFGYGLPVVRDTAAELVRQSGVTVTPEVAVIVPGGARAYRGRIDDRYVDFGRDRPAPTVRDLEQALSAVLEGKPVERPETRAVGCYLSDLIRQ